MTDRVDIPAGSGWGQIKVLAKESAVYGFATMATGLIGIVLTPLYTRRLPVEDFALVAVLTSLSTLLVTAASLSMENAAHRWYWLTEDDDERGAVFTTWFVSFATIAVGLTILAAAMAPVLSDWLGSPGRGAAVVLAISSVPLRVPFLVGMNWLRARRQPGWVIVVSVAQAATTVGLTFLLLSGDDPSVELALVAQVVAFGVSSAVLLVPARSWWRPARVRLDLYRSLLRFALPLVPAALASWALALADRGLLKLLSDSSEVAAYQAAVTWSLAIGLPVAAFQQAWGPFGLSIAKRPDADDVYRRVLVLLVHLLCVGGTFAALVAPEAMDLVFGSGYRDAALAGAMLGFGQVSGALFQHTALYFLLDARTGPIGSSFLLGAVVNIGLGIVLIPSTGADGAALAMLLAQAGMVVYLAWRTGRLDRPTHAWSWPLAVPACTFVVSLAVVRADAPVRIAVGVGMAAALGASLAWTLRRERLLPVGP